MRSIVATAAVFMVTALPPALHASDEARCAQWTCKAFFGNNGYAYYYEGKSDAYPPSTWLDARYKQQAEDRALDNCGEQAGGIRCYIMDCDKGDSDDC